MTKLKVCVIGPGVVGQATGKALALKGVEVEFLGGRQSRIDQLRKEGFTAHEKDAFLNGGYDFDISLLTVPTPTEDKKINLSIMEDAAIELGKRLKHTKKYHVVVVKSTVPPGTTRNLVVKQIEKHSGKKLGKDFGAVMNPEYLREEKALEDSIKAWLIVIGEHDKKSGDMIAEMYKGFDCPTYRVSLEEAEMQKYVHNLYNAAKISFFNEMREIGKQLGVDTERMFKLVAMSSEGIWNPEYGIRDMGPFSGSCLPKDTQAFLDFAENKGYDARLLRNVIEVNDLVSKRLGIKEQKREYTL